MALRIGAAEPSRTTLVDEGGETLCGAGDGFEEDAGVCAIAAARRNATHSETKTARDRVEVVRLRMVDRGILLARFPAFC